MSLSKISRRWFLMNAWSALSIWALPESISKVWSILTSRSPLDILKSLKNPWTSPSTSDPLFILFHGFSPKEFFEKTQKFQENFLWALSKLPPHLLEKIDLEKSTFSSLPAILWQKKDGTQGVFMQLSMKIEKEQEIYVKMADESDKIVIFIKNHAFWWGSWVKKASYDFNQGIKVLQQPLEQIYRTVEDCYYKDQDDYFKRQIKEQEEQLRRQKQEFNKKYKKYLDTTALTSVFTITDFDINNVKDFSMSYIVEWILQK